MNLQKSVVVEIEFGGLCCERGSEEPGSSKERMPTQVSPLSCPRSCCYAAPLPVSAVEVIWCSRYPTRPSVWLKNVWVRLSKEVWEKHLDSHTASNARLRSEEGSGFWMWRTFDRKVLENHKMERWIWKTKIRLFASVIWSLILKGRMCHHIIFLEKNIS